MVCWYVQITVTDYGSQITGHNGYLQWVVLRLGEYRLFEVVVEVVFYKGFF